MRTSSEDASEDAQADVEYEVAAPSGEPATPIGAPGRGESMGESMGEPPRHDGRALLASTAVSTTLDVLREYDVGASQNAGMSVDSLIHDVVRWQGLSVASSVLTQLSATSVVTTMGGVSSALGMGAQAAFSADALAAAVTQQLNYNISVTQAIIAPPALPPSMPPLPPASPPPVVPPAFDCTFLPNVTCADQGVIDDGRGMGLAVGLTFLLCACFCGCACCSRYCCRTERRLKHVGWSGDAESSYQDVVERARGQKGVLYTPEVSHDPVIELSWRPWSRSSSKVGTVVVRDVDQAAWVPSHAQQIRQMEAMEQSGGA